MNKTNIFVSLVLLLLLPPQTGAQQAAGQSEEQVVSLQSLYLQPVMPAGVSYALMLGHYREQQSASDAQQGLAGIEQPLQILRARDSLGQEIFVLTLGEFASEAQARIWKNRLLSRFGRESQLIQLPPEPPAP